MNSRMTLSSARLGSLPPAAPRPRLSASRRATITSSAVDRMARVFTETGFVWPIRCTRLMAWVSTSACHTGSQNMTREAVMMFLGWPCISVCARKYEERVLTDHEHHASTP